MGYVTYPLDLAPNTPPTSPLAISPATLKGSLEQEIPLPSDSVVDLSNPINKTAADPNQQNNQSRTASYSPFESGSGGTGNTAASNGYFSTQSDVIDEVLGHVLYNVDLGMTLTVNYLAYTKGFATGLLYDGAWGTVTGIGSLAWHGTELWLSQRAFDYYFITRQFDKARETKFFRFSMGIAATISNPTVRALFVDFAVPGGLINGIDPKSKAFMNKGATHINIAA